MTRSEAIKALFFKSVLPVTVALILYCIFKSACMKNGELDYVSSVSAMRSASSTWFRKCTVSSPSSSRSIMR